MHVIVPTWLYAFEAVMHLVSSFVILLLSLYFHRMYSLSSDKRHMLVHLAFLLLSMGLIVLSISSMFSFAARIGCNSSGPCSYGLAVDILSLEDFAYLAYFGFSLFAYILFILVYAEEYLKFSRIFVLAFVGYLLFLVTVLPVKAGHGLWYSYNEYFHLTSFVFLIFISFRNFVNYSEMRSDIEGNRAIRDGAPMKSLNALIVASSFSMISLFHLFHLFAFLGGWMYLLGHISLLLGFAGFFVLIMRVMKLSVRIKFFNRLVAHLARFERSLLHGSKQKDKAKGKMRRVFGLGVQ